MSKIVWKPIDDKLTLDQSDDLIAIDNDYTLRVEQMNNRHWWWSVLYKEDQIEEATRITMILYLKQSNPCKS